VFIDTAGRYTTQDSQAEVDKAAWLGFLRLLKHHRRRQPLNGVLVAISLSDLATLDEDERRALPPPSAAACASCRMNSGYAAGLRAVHQADLVVGFTEFFNKLGREEREQVWGVTLPLDNGRDEAGSVGGFRAAFDKLLDRLNDSLLERVHEETDLQRRRLIYSFRSRSPRCAISPMSF